MRVLDIGCAGGRNAVYLARLGFDVHALDASEAMVAETRRRPGGNPGGGRGEDTPRAHRAE